VLDGLFLSKEIFFLVEMVAFLFLFADRQGGVEAVNAYGLAYLRSRPSSTPTLAITLLSRENHRLTPVPEETQA